MIKTKSIISGINEVPREWVFEYYLNLDQKLTGQDVKIKSVFNITDKNPSLSVYYTPSFGGYRFKDFSSGKSGDGVSFVQHKFELSTRGEAAHKIMSDYNEFILTSKDDYSLRKFKVHSKYKISAFTVRKWNVLDQKYWTNFHIGSKILDSYYVKPLESYTMTKEEDGDIKELHIKGRNYSYGYFRADGTLYKIYQPMVKDSKFIKIKDYIQGTDQLTMKVPYLVICSSLKDLMAFMKLGYKNAEAIAPDSENTLIPEHIIAAYKLKYKSICVLFDNDAPGIEAMQKYKDKYDLQGLHLKLSKDLSDSIKDQGVFKVRDIITPLLKKALHYELVI